MITKSDKTNPGDKHRYFLWLRTLLGFGILVAVVTWIVNEGSLFERLNASVLLWSTTISALTSLLHAFTLIAIARTYERRLDLRYAIYISTLGSLGNAAGGLPLGTTLKYAILHNKVGLKISQITFGLLSFTVGISLALLGYAALSIYGLEFPAEVKALPSVLLVGSVILLALLIRWAHTKAKISALINPLLKKRNLTTLVLLSSMVATLLILNSCAVGWHMLPVHPVIQVVFISASGILIGLASLLQAVAGIQEIAMGLSAYASGISAVDGAQLALVLRFTSIISSGLILSVHLLIPGPRKPR